MARRFDLGFLRTHFAQVGACDFEKVEIGNFRPKTLRRQLVHSRYSASSYMATWMSPSAG